MRESKHVSIIVVLLVLILFIVVAQEIVKKYFLISVSNETTEHLDVYSNRACYDETYLVEYCHPECVDYINETISFDNTTRLIETCSQYVDSNDCINITKIKTICELESYSAPINYVENGSLKTINTTIKVSPDINYNYAVINNIYEAYFKSNPTSGQVVKVLKEGYETTFQPMALNYRNDLNQLQQINMVQPITGQPNENEFIYSNAYGMGIDLKYTYNTDNLKEGLIISNLSSLTLPAQYIIDGKNVTLDLDFVLTTNTKLFINGIEWDKTTEVSTTEMVVIKDLNDIPIYTLPKPIAIDSNGSTIDLVYRFKKSSNKLYVIIKTNYTWLQNAVYPIMIDPTITFDYVSTIEDSGITSASPNNNFGSEQMEDLESYATGGTRLFFKLNISKIPSSATITNATFYIYKYVDGTETTNYVYLTPNNWTESTITWNNQPTYNSSVNTTDNGIGIGWIHYDLTQMVSWAYNNSLNNVSFLIKTEENHSDTNPDYFRMSEYSTSTYRPFFQVIYSYAGMEVNVTSCTTVNTSGKYYLTANITNSTKANCVYFTDGVDDVLFDCQNNQIDLEDNANYAIGFKDQLYHYYNNLTIQNCLLSDADVYAIDMYNTQEGSGTANITLINITLSSNPDYGIMVYNSKDLKLNNIRFNQNIGDNGIYSSIYISTVDRLNITTVVSTNASVQGIYLESVNNSYINDVTLNGYKGCSNPMWLFDVYNTIIRNLTATNCGGVYIVAENSYPTGIMVNGEKQNVAFYNITIYNQTDDVSSLSNVSYGLSFTGSESNVTFTDLKINYTDNSGVYMGSYPSEITFKDVQIQNTQQRKTISYNSSPYNFKFLQSFGDVNCHSIIFDNVKGYNNLPIEMMNNSGFIVQNWNGNYSGLYVCSPNVDVKNITSINKTDGLILLDGRNSTIVNNTFNQNSTISLGYVSSGTRMFNNIINTTKFYGVEAGIPNVSIDKQLGIRVYGEGNWIAGNYWATGYSINCTDVDFDGICDFPYNFSSVMVYDYNYLKNIVDYFPLSSKGGDTTNPTIPLFTNNASLDTKYLSKVAWSFNLSDNNRLYNWSFSENSTGSWIEVNSSSVFINTTNISLCLDFDGNSINECGDEDGVESGTENTTGKINGAYNFTANDHVNVSSMALQGNQFTINWWEYIRSEQPKDANFGYVFCDSKNVTNLLIRHYNSSGTIVYVIYVGGTQLTFKSELSATYGSWNFISVTYNTTGHVKLYRNGVLVSYSTTSDTDFKGITTNIMIGNRNGIDRDFIGLIDSLSVYERTLSDVEIFRMYNNQKGYQYGYNETYFTQVAQVNATRGIGVCGNITVYDSAGNLNNSLTSCFVVNNTKPTINTSIRPLPVVITDFMNGSISYYDVDGDNPTLNETMWFLNGVSQADLVNKTVIGAGNLSVDQHWIFSARTKDAQDWSDWKNSSEVVLGDTDSPTIDSTYVSDLDIYSDENLVVSINCSDPTSPIGEAKFQIEYSGNYENRTLTYVTGDLWRYSSTFGTGTYNITHFYCWDTSNYFAKDNTSYFITVTTKPVVGGGGGGGGVVVTPVVFYGDVNATYFDVKTETGSKKYELLLQEDEIREKIIQVYNLYEQNIKVDLSCYGDLCDKVYLEKNTVELSKKSVESVVFSVNTSSLELGTTYFFGIKGLLKEINGTSIADTEKIGAQKVEVYATITPLSFLRVWFEKFVSSYNLFGVEIPKLIVYLFLAFIITLIVVAITKKKEEKATFGALSFMLTIILSSIFDDLLLSII